MQIKFREGEHDILYATRHACVYVCVSVCMCVCNNNIIMTQVELSGEMFKSATACVMHVQTKTPSPTCCIRGQSYLWEFAFKLRFTKSIKLKWD